MLEIKHDYRGCVVAEVMVVGSGTSYDWQSGGEVISTLAVAQQQW